MHGVDKAVGHVTDVESDSEDADILDMNLSDDEEEERASNETNGGIASGADLNPKLAREMKKLASSFKACEF